MNTYLPIRNLPILLLLLAPLAHSHENEAETTSTTGAATATSSTVQQPFTLSANLDARYLSKENSTAMLPLAGISNMRQAHYMYGRSGIGLTWADTVYIPVKAIASVSYSDQEQKVLPDTVRLEATPIDNLTLSAGRMNPMPVMGAIPQGAVTNLMSAGLLGDDHWHADGFAVKYGDINNDIHAGVFAKKAYPGSQGSVGAVTLGGGWQPQQYTQQPSAITFKADIGYAPDIIRQTIDTSTNPFAHTHVTDVASCGSKITCVDGNALWLLAGAKWQPKYRWLDSIDSYALLRKEKGILNSPDGLADYQGNTTGFLLYSKHPLLQHIDSGLSYEWLAITHDITGSNATTIAKDAGVLTNSRNASRLGAWIGYKLDGINNVWLKGAQLQAAVYDDKTHATNETLMSLRLLWRWQQGFGGH